eukprot:TRINITY_DN1398_c0_g1_i2.p1 TRINITY_DN1398_c0_g1~~TRINITY_DN1398_c0_g1_i2.p1  ORF type:complete len:1243 (+),score=262.10 TRINITY_DN1398_c0_g1_i2:101-3730(+)
MRLAAAAAAWAAASAVSGAAEAAALIPVNGADTVWSGNCSVVNSEALRASECWHPTVPGPADVIGFASYTRFNSSSAVAAETAVAVGGMVIAKYAHLTIVQGSLEINGPLTVGGTLIIEQADKLNPGERATLNPSVFKVDHAARAAGLRDCAFVPGGFEPRICGNSTVTILDGGVLKVQGMYASVFAAVNVRPGGTYQMRSGAFQWAAVDNSGLMDVTRDHRDPIYWHGTVHNRPGGKINLRDPNGYNWMDIGPFYFDEWAAFSVGKPEPPFLPFVNEGEMELTISLRGTFYSYENDVAGVYSAGILNKAGGKLTFTGESQINELWPIDNHGEIVVEGELTIAGATGRANITNRPNGTILVTTGTMSMSVVNLVNEGSIKWTSQVALEWSFTNVNNTGTIELQAEQGGWITGNLLNAAPGRLIFEGGTWQVYHAERWATANIDNYGRIAVNACTLTIGSYYCYGGEMHIYHGGIIQLVGNSWGDAPAGFLQSRRAAVQQDDDSAPTVCTAGLCFSDPCPYAQDEIVQACCLHMLPDGSCATPGVTDPYSLSSICYACSPSGPAGAAVHNERLRSRLAAAPPGGSTPPPGRAGGAVGRDGPELMKARAAALHTHHFERARIKGDGTGSVVTTGPLGLQGRNALRIDGLRMFAVVEHGWPAFLGGGRITVGSTATLALGIDSVLNGGGEARVEPGGRLLVDKHAAVHVGNFSLHLPAGAELRVDGQLGFNEEGRVRLCGAHRGTGTMFLSEALRQHVAEGCGADAAAVLTREAPPPVQGPKPCSSDLDCALNGKCGDDGICLCSMQWQSHDCSMLTFSAVGGFLAGNHTQSDNIGSLAGPAFGPQGAIDELGKHIFAAATPPGCPSGGGRSIAPDTYIAHFDALYSAHPSKDLPGLSTGEGYFTSHTGGSPYPWVAIEQAAQPALLWPNSSFENPFLYFAYIWPEVCNCKWNKGACVGTCADGTPCGHRPQSACACAPQCSFPRPTIRGNCGVRIAAAHIRRKTATNPFIGMLDAASGPGDADWVFARDGSSVIRGSSGCPTEPSPLLLANGSVLLYYSVDPPKGAAAPHGRVVGVARSDSGPGGPFAVLREGLWADADTVESPFVWRDSRGNFHMLAGGVWPSPDRGRHAYSKNGIDWYLSPGHAYNTSVEGTDLQFARRTRPQMVLDARFTQGVPSTRQPALFTLVEDADGYGSVHMQPVLGIDVREGY